MKKQLHIFIILCLCSFQIFSVIMMNDQNKAFPEPEAGTIEDCMIDGASDYLNSYSETIALLNGTNTSTTNNEGGQEILNGLQASFNVLLKSRSHYQRALDTALNSSYLNYQIEKLKAFDYPQVVSDLQMAPEPAALVIEYLKRGDIIGIYQRNLQSIDEIIDMFKDVMSAIQNGDEPNENVVESLLEKFSTTAILGNYSTILANSAFKSED